MFGVHMNQRCLLELLKASPELPLDSEDTGQSETPARAGSPERPVNLCSFSHQSEKVFEFETGAAPKRQCVCTLTGEQLRHCPRLLQASL